MEKNKQNKEGLMETIESLIKAGTSFDIAALDQIYHNDLQIIMINNKKDKMIADKQAFKNLFKEKLDNGDAPLNTWASYIHTEVNKDHGHIIVLRRVNLTGVEKEIIINIDLIWEDERWQVIREVITD